MTADTEPRDLRFTYAGTPLFHGPYIYVRPEDIEAVLTRYTDADGTCATLLMRSGQQIPVYDPLLDVRTRLDEARSPQGGAEHPPDHKFTRDVLLSLLIKIHEELLTARWLSGETWDALRAAVGNLGPPAAPAAKRRSRA